MDEEENNLTFEKSKTEAISPVYYGPVVRQLLFSAGLVLLLAVLVDRSILAFYLTIGVIEIVALMIFAAFTSRGYRGVIVLDFLISLINFLIFEFFAITRFYEVNNIFNIVFLVRQTLAIIFILALYFSSKTIIGYLISRTRENNGP